MSWEEIVTKLILQSPYLALLVWVIHLVDRWAHKFGDGLLRVGAQIVDRLSALNQKVDARLNHGITETERKEDTDEANNRSSDRAVSSRNRMPSG